MLVNNNRNKATENPPPVIALPTGMKQNICSIHSLSYCLYYIPTFDEGVKINWEILIDLENFL